MNTTIEDLRFTIVPRSDQLNSEQLLGGPITIRVTDVRIGTSDEQPIKIHYEDDNGRPFLPCKTMRKVLIFAWGADGREWIGRWMTLYNDPQVRFGGAEVGGIRISHMSDILGDIKVSLTATKGKKAMHTVLKMDAPTESHDAAMKACATVESLKQAFKAAYRSTKDRATLDAYKATYDARLAVLTAKSPLDDYIAAVNSATSAETASLALDEARDVLPPDQFVILATVFGDRWTA